jgi:TetR/AcrR family transcriptional regulator, cholesterol catabolism regulator
MQPSEEAATADRIIEQATRLFVSRGYTGISMREIAEAVGVSKAGLYYHFEDKEALFLAILTANLARVESAIQAARREGATARDQISRMMRSIMEQAPEQRAIIRLAGQEMVHLSQAARAEFGRIYQKKFINQVEDILLAGVERGELKPTNVRLATWILLGMAYPFVYPAHERELGGADEAIDVMVTIFLDGLARKANLEMEQGGQHGD